ncbi:MAG: hypothetical protein Tsb0013_06050 [Phycisphaerales bacterium]
MKPNVCQALAPIIASLLAFHPARAETVVLAFETPSPIPDGAGALSIPLAYDTALRTVTGVRLEIDLAHPWVGDLVIAIEAPDASALLVVDRPGTVPAGFPGPWGCGGDNIDATFTDSATISVLDACTLTGTPVYTGDLLPAQVLASFVGVNPQGAWTVTVADAQAGDAGVLNAVRLVLDVEQDCDLDGVPDDCANCPADFDNDGDVDLGDFGVFGSAFGSMTGDVNYDQKADLDGDGDVDLGDFGVFGGEFGRSDCA